MAADTRENLKKMQESLEWLAKAYWDVPKRDFLESFSQVDFDIYGEAAGEGLTLVRDDVDFLSDEILRSIAVDFTSLFAACKRNAPYPYESVFLGDKRLVMQGVRDSVLQSFEEGGYEVVPEGDGSREPEDHISYELGYVASQYGRAAAALAEDDEEAVLNALARVAVFEADHLRKWVPVFCREVEGSAETSFFKGLAKLTQTAVELMRERR